jgi:hypothetical protein
MGRMMLILGHGSRSMRSGSDRDMTVKDVNILLCTLVKPVAYLVSRFVLL